MKPNRHRFVSKKTVADMVRGAARLWQEGRYGNYFDAMQKIAEADPGNDGVAIDIGAAYAMRYDYPAAERWFERAVAGAKNKSAALAMIGLQCRNAIRYDLAERYLERAAEAKGATPDTLAKLAEMYERLRRTDKAGETVGRALRLDGTNALALLVTARLARSAGRPDEGERLVRSFLGRSGEDSWSTRIRGWYELGANLDFQGRYAEAMAAFLSAKAMIRPIAGPYLAAQREARAKLAEAAEKITGEVLHRWVRESGATIERPSRLAVIGGHPRSGTTLLEQLLDSHPGVVSAEETAIFFEAALALRRRLPPDAGMLETFGSIAPEVLHETRDWYLHAMQNFVGSPVGGRLLIDKNPSLTGLVPGLARVFPEARFVVALRDPRDVCLSCFMQPLPLNPASSSFLSLEETVTEYESLMGFWRAMAPRLPNPAIEVRYEDVVTDTASVARTVLSFLGLEWDERVLRFDEHARRKLVRSPTYAEVARPISTAAVGRWKNYQEYLGPLLRRLEPFLAAFGYGQ
jgi:tetratricopeptide (TPR) repeat protein